MNVLHREQPVLLDRQAVFNDLLNSDRVITLLHFLQIGVARVSPSVFKDLSIKRKLGEPWLHEVQEICPFNFRRSTDAKSAFDAAYFNACGEV